MKNCSIFAAHYVLDGGRIRLYAAGIFYALALLAIYGFATPCGALMRPLPSRCSATGSAEPFFYFPPQQTILSVMHYTEKIATGKKHSTPASTPDCESVNQLSQLNLLPNAQDVTQSNEHGDNVYGQNAQANRVQENYGVTGISGTGHTINIYQYPKELVELLKKVGL
jgi:hypothetical protein